MTKEEQVISLLERIAVALESQATRSPAIATGKPNNENLFKCPACDSPMVRRFNRKEQTDFYGCSNYPDCKATRNFDGSEVKKKSYTTQPSSLEEEPPL